MIRSNVEYEGITKNFRELKLHDIYTLQQLDTMDEKEQALQLEKLLKSEISEHIETNPSFKKFSERLRTIRDQFEKSQIYLSGRIKLYKDLLDDVKSAHEEAEASGMELRAYGLYLLAKEFSQSDDSAIRRYVGDLVRVLDEEVLDPGW